MEKMTELQKRFCDSYMIDLNGKRAYLETYNCSDKAAEAGASRLLRVVKVKNYVDNLKAQVSEDVQVTVKSVIAGILDTQKRAKGDDNYAAELKASDMLAKHVGAYEKDNEQQGLSITDIMAIAQGKR